MSSSPLRPVEPAFPFMSLHDSSASSAFLSALTGFYRDTPGASRLLIRSRNSARDVADGTAEAAAALNPSGLIIAAALLYHHNDELAEIGSVLVSPEGAGLYSHLRQKLSHRGGQLGKTTTLFERLPDSDPALFDYERARRQAEGWQVMKAEHPDFRFVERLKQDMPLSNGGHPPKIGFRKAAGHEAGQNFVYRKIGFRECFPFRDSTYSLGR